MDSPLRAAVLGYGLAGRFFHTPLIRTTPGLAVRAVASSDPARVHADLGGEVAVGPWAEIVARPDVDLVVIASPNPLHAPQALAALAAGKHVVVDKPMALDAAEAATVADAAARANRLLAVFHNRRRDSDFLTVARVLREGRLGRVVAFGSRFDRFRPVVPQRWRDAEGPGGGLWIDLGPHLVDQALRLFGAPEAITLDLLSQRDGARTDDAFDATLRFAGGLHARLGATALAAIPGARFLVHGTRGSLRIDGLDGQEDALRAGRLPGGADWGAETRTATLVTGDAGGTRAESLPLERGDWPGFYAAVRDAIRGAAPNPVPPAEAIAVQRLLDLGRESHREQRTLAAR